MAIVGGGPAGAAAAIGLARAGRRVLLQGLLDALYTGHLAAGAVDAALDSDGGAVTAYTARLESVRAAYLRHLRRAYRDEDRWPDAPFWRRRQRSPVPA